MRTADCLRRRRSSAGRERKHSRPSGQRVQLWSYGAAELALAEQAPSALKRSRHCRASSVLSTVRGCAGICLL